MEGWVKFHRRYLSSDLWLSEPFTKGQAWVDLFSIANHKDGFIRVRGNRVEVKRGQVAWSQLKLSKRWKWSRGKVRRFLDELENIDEKIVQQKTRVTTLINILNYESYQSGDTTDGQQTVQQTDNRQYTNKNVKKEKKRTVTPDVNFKPTAEKIYSGYIEEINPKLKTKQRAVTNIETWLNRGRSENDLILAYKNYKEIMSENNKYRKNPANFYGINEDFAYDFLPINYKSDKITVFKPKIETPEEAAREIREALL
jgi:hypothetical protein